MSRPIGLVLLLLGLTGAPARGDNADAEPVPELSFEPVPGATDTSAQATPSSEDRAFLAVPAFDVEWAQALNKAVRIGDTLELKVAGVPAGVRAIAHPESADALNEQGWEVEASKGPGGKSAAGEFYFSATPIKKGTLTIPSLALRDETGNTIARTNPLSVKVESAIAADDPHPDQPVEIRPPEALPYPWWLWLMAGVGILVLAAGLFFALRRWRRRGALPVSLAPAAPPAPEDEEALAALLYLEKQGFLRQGKFKPYYFRVSEILKHYLGRRYSFDAPESTTNEMIRQLAAQYERPAVIEPIEALFNRMDLIKFTDHLPTPDEAEALVGHARQLIRQTARPAPLIGKPGDAV